MKKSGLLLILPLILISLMSFVAASPLDDFMYGFFGLEPGSEWAGITIVIIVFLMLAFSFSDIISMVTLFSKRVAYILGFGLAIIASLTRVTLTLAFVLFQVTATFGIISVAVSLIAAFVVWMLVHLGVWSVGKYILKMKAMKGVDKKVINTTAGIKYLGEVGKYVAE